MSAKVTLKNQLRRLLSGKRECAQKRGDLGSWIRISAILDLDAGRSVPKTAATFAADEQTVRNWVGNLAEYGISSLDRGKSPGRPPKLTESQRKELENMIDDSPTRHGFTSALWRSPMIQKLIHDRFNVFYSVKYIAELLKNMGFSFQKAKFVSDHLDAKKRKEWLDKTWPKILREAEDKYFRSV